MKSLNIHLRKLSVVQYFRIKWFAVSVLLWTMADLFILSRWHDHSGYLNTVLHNERWSTTAIWTGISIVVNSLIGWLLFEGINRISEKKYPVGARVLKGMVVFTTISLLVGIRYLCMILLAREVTLNNLVGNAWEYIAANNFLADAIVIQSLLVLVIYLSYQIGQKYTPGFFMKMMLGNYSTPRNEERIIMFMDLKDSTSISEQLDHSTYFLFIRDFIYLVSNAALRNDADIYQYVGDEVIVTWPKIKENGSKCVDTLILCRRHIEKKKEYFKRRYGIIPEFRAGIHAGSVTVGEIGVVKKDIAMSGEAMNLTARIRSACSDLNQQQIVSKDYFDFTNLQQWQGDDLGLIDIKGIEKRDIRLYGLKI